MLILNAAGDASGESTPAGAKIHLLNRMRDRGGKVDYRMASKGDTGEIYLYDMIGAWGITAAQFKDDLKALGAVKTIDLHINSDGGDVFEGRAIYTMLAQHPARVVAYIDGLAASIASLIAMAANEIRLADGAWLMVHNAWSLAIGDAAEIRRTADLLDSVSNSMLDTYVARTRQPRADLKKMMDDETWMTGQEAIDKGFADVLDEPVRLAAQVRNPSLFNHVPAVLTARHIHARTLIERIAARTKTPT